MQRQQLGQARSGTGTRSGHVWTKCTLRAAQRRGSLTRVHSTSPAVAEPPSPTSTTPVNVRVLYRTGWDKAFIHGSLLGGPWQDYPLTKEAGPGLDRWLGSAIVLPKGAEAANGGKPLLEFVITSGKGDWDKPQAGGNYQISSPGAYSLRGGRLNSITGPAALVVSDLDGTMVGDDAATGAFKSWWEDVGALRGGKLIYNTGRSLESFQELIASKAAVMAQPDGLISAVGTKIYNREGGKWVEDPAWSSMLDDGWDVNTAREAAYRMLAQVGKDAMHFRPPEEQNTHKVTVGVRDDAASHVIDGLNDALPSSGVRANVICSGHGGWKYVDVVPLRAGKLQALEYVRRKLGFSLGATVACGDSGNDILMLSGENLAIVVGNAQPDLRAWVTARQSVETPLPNGKQRLLQASKPEAYGILEGLEYYGLK